MVVKNALKKKIHEAIQEATGPKSLKQRLSGAVEKLSQEHLDELQKQVDPSAHDKLITKKINALKDLSTHLQDAGRTVTDTIEVNITTIIEELKTMRRNTRRPRVATCEICGGEGTVLACRHG